STLVVLRPLHSFPTRRSSDLPSTHTLWRLSVPSTSPAFLQDLPQLIEWGGALRWLWSDLPASQLREETAKQGGTATAFRHPHDQDRKSTRLNSSHVKISYAVF